MADINDRLDRLNRREELARRVLRRPIAEPPAGLDEDFREVVDAVARTVRRFPGLSVMVAPADGRSGRTVIRVTERDGFVETAVVTPPRSVPAGPAPAPAAQPPAQPAGALAADRGRHAVPPDDAGPRNGTGADEAPARSEPVPGSPAPAPGVPGVAGLVTLPADTRQVVTRLAQMLREDPTLTSHWAPER
jgi:hypothetical protein